MTLARVKPWIRRQQGFSCWATAKAPGTGLVGENGDTYAYIFAPPQPPCHNNPDRLRRPPHPNLTYSYDALSRRIALGDSYGGAAAYERRFSLLTTSPDRPGVSLCVTEL